MAGLAVAALLGGGAAAIGSTAAAVLSSGLAGVQAVGSGVKAFSEASKAKKRGEAAARAAKKSARDAKNRLAVNTAERLSIAKEPYELMREASLVSGATGLQAAQEADTRGAAATAGRMQMSNLEQGGQIRAAMGDQLFEIEKLKAEEDRRIAEQIASVELAEAEGAQEALRYAEEDQAAYLKQGFDALSGLADRALKDFKAGEFDNQDVDAEGNPIPPTPRTDRFGMTREQRRAMTPEQRRAARDAVRSSRRSAQTSSQPVTERLDELARTPDVDLGSPRQQRRSANQSVGVLAGPGFNSSSAEALGGALDFVTGYDTGVDLSPVGGQPLSPGQLDRQMEREIRPQQRAEARVARQDARDRRRQGQPGLPPELTPEERSQLEQRELIQQQEGARTARSMEREENQREELDRVITENAQREGAGPVRTDFPGPVDLDQRLETEIDRATRQRSGYSFAGAGLSEGLSNFYGEGAPTREATGPRSDEAAGGDPMKVVGEARTMDVSNVSELFTALENDKIPQTTQNQELRVSLGGAQDTTALLVGLRDSGVIDAEIVEPTTPQNAEESKQDVAESAAGESSEVRSAVERVANSVDSNNPVPIALQWLGIKEVNTQYSKPDPNNPSDSIVVKLDVDKALKTNDEGAALLTAIWQNVGLGADSAREFITAEQAWCGGFVNHVLTEGGFDTKVKGAYNKMRADSYAGLGTKVYVSEKAEKYYAASGRAKERNGGKVLASGNPMNAKVGDIVVKDSGKNRHVGFFVGYDDDGNVLMLGGNQNNEVNITAYPVEKIWAVRRVTSHGLNDDEKNKLSGAIAGGASTSGETL